MHPEKSALVLIGNGHWIGNKGTYTRISYTCFSCNLSEVEQRKSHQSKVLIPPQPLLSFSRGARVAEAGIELMILHFPGDRITDFSHHTQLEFPN